MPDELSTVSSENAAQSSFVASVDARTSLFEATVVDLPVLEPGQSMAVALCSSSAGRLSWSWEMALKSGGFRALVERQGALSEQLESEFVALAQQVPHAEGQALVERQIEGLDLRKRVDDAVGVAGALDHLRLVDALAEHGAEVAPLVGGAEPRYDRQHARPCDLVCVVVVGERHNHDELHGVDLAERGHSLLLEAAHAQLQRLFDVLVAAHVDEIGGQYLRRLAAAVGQNDPELRLDHFAAVVDDIVGVGGPVERVPDVVP
ncbi:DEDD exonuclease domain-containing protein [Babesia caballi]|uniref:DEDD exonuclease domain-containing protein n=1 Tax=Babesia caballi TaxID=5871 RepID=A0AAV4LPR2_BABCB|nr:DEDD exonuclease domain-containing protein [Babesia caballi]